MTRGILSSEQQSGARRSGWLAAMPMMVGIGIFSLYPFVYLIGLSVTDSTLARPMQGWAGLDNFRAALSDQRYLDTLWRSGVLALFSTFLTMVVGISVALLLDRAVRGRSFLRTLILLPLLTPPVSVAIMWQLILMPQGGWLNSLLSGLSLSTGPISFLGEPTLAFLSLVLVDVWQWSPFVALMVYAALKTLPGEVFDACRLEIRSKWVIFRQITMPMLLPALIGVCLLKLVMSFKIFDTVFVLTAGGPGQATTVSGFYIYRVAIQQFDIGLAAAQTLLFAVLVALATVPLTILRRRVEDG